MNPAGRGRENEVATLLAAAAMAAMPMPADDESNRDD
jgi:hypothetical protein